MTVLAVVGVIVAAMVFMGDESKPSYQPLFTNLQSSDAGAITQQLASQKIPYQLANGGSTVLVPAADVDQERIALAQQGLPQAGNVGFSNLEKSGITTSDFVQQVEYQQALEGQLEQTISSIQGVQSAQVNLVVPQQSDFAVGTQQATTASILVNLSPGTSLSSGQVSAVVHLAASSVPGLKSSDVTVVDNHGDVLTAPGDAGGTSGASNTQQTDAYDNQLAASLTALLARVVGEGNAAVQVNALLNFNQSQTTTNGLQLNAQGQPVTAPTGQNTSNSTYNGTGTPPSGVLGSSQPSTTTGGNGTYTTTSSQVTNAVGQVSQTVKQAPGQVERTSVAVLLNSSKAKKVDQTQVESLVTAAAGLNKANGDQLVVTSMPFASAAGSQSAAETAASASAHRQQLLEHAGEIGGLLLLIAAMVAVTLWAAKRRRPFYQEIALGELGPMASMIPVEEERNPTGELPAVRARSDVAARFRRRPGTGEPVRRAASGRSGPSAQELGGRARRGRRGKGAPGMTTTAPSTPGTDRDADQPIPVAVASPAADRVAPSVRLTNRQKVAVVLAQLGSKKATPILKEMSDPDAIAFTTELANLPALDTDTVVGILAELVDRIHESTLVSQGGITLARQFLQERLGQARADEVLEELENKNTSGPLAVLAHADPRQVVAILAEQQPQTVAVLLAHMRPEDAARIMAELPGEFRIKVARRIAQLERVDPAAVRQTTALIEAKLRSLHTVGALTVAGGASAIAEILNHSDRQTERQILGELESEDSELVEQIRASLFTFDDVIALDARSLQQILRRVPTSTLATALKGAQLDTDAMAHIRGNLTERGAQTLDEELEVLGAIRTSQVDAAQAEIVRTARELDAEGVIVIARNDEVVQ